MNNTKTPNMTLIFIAISLVSAIGITGGIILTIYDKDASAFYGFFTATLTSVVGFAAVTRSTGKIGEAVEDVQVKVNGRMSQLMDMVMTKGDVTHEEVGKLAKISRDTGVTPTVRTETPVYDATVRGE